MHESRYLVIWSSGYWIGALCNHATAESENNQIIRYSNDQMCTSKVMALREEVADRHEVEQYDREADGREVRRAPSTPPDAARREQLEGVYEPADDREEDFRILQRHRLDARIAGPV